MNPISIVFQLLRPLHPLHPMRRGAALALLGLLGLCANAHALSCPDGQEKDGALCYPKARDGYTCTASLCVANCPDGYKSSGIGTCHYASATTYTEKPYISRSHSGMQRCLALFYNNCRSGYHMDVCGICSYKGAWDTTRKSYDRGPGSNPDVTAAFNRVSDTARATWGRTEAGMKSVYASALAGINGVAQDVLYSAAKEVAHDVANQKSCNVKQFDSNVKALKANADLGNKLKRIVVMAAKGKADPQIPQDMQEIARAVGVFGSAAKNCFPLYDKWSLGVFGKAEETAGAGVYYSVGIVITIPTSDKAPVDVRSFVQAGASFGPEAVSTDEIGLFLAAGPASSLDGPEIGVSMVLDADVGVNAGIGISVPTQLPSFDPLDLQGSIKKWLAALAPTIALGVSVGEGGGAAVTTGYGKTAQLN